MTVISVQQKLQRGRRLLSKAGNDPDLLGTALGSIHGALEDACREWLAAPNIRRQHGIDVNDKSKASWNVLLGLAQRYCGWSQQDVEYVSRMNYLRNQTAHGDPFQGTCRDVEAYLTYVENAVTHGAVFDRDTNYKTNQPFYETRQFKSFLVSKYSFPILWLVGTFFGLIIGGGLGATLLEILGLSMEGVDNQLNLEGAVAAIIMFAGMG